MQIRVQLQIRINNKNSHEKSIVNIGINSHNRIK